MLESYWNHRVIKKVYPNGEEYYSVHEVHYNPDGTIYGHTVDPIQLSCESMDALREYILWCLKSLDKPVLEDGKIEFVSYDDDIIPEELEDEEEDL